MLHARLPFPGFAARTLVTVAALVAGAAVMARAQVPVKPAPVLQPPPTLTRELLAAADLAIDKVQIAQVQTGALQAVAYVTIRNAGSLAAVFPAGSVLVSATPTDSRGIRFPNLVAQSQFTVAPGQSQVLVLRSQDPCTGGWSPLPVSFQVNPQGAVPERQRANNAILQAPPVADVSTSDLVVSNLRLGIGTDPRDNRSQAMLLVVTAKNNGAGPALLCPGMTLARQTASPLAAKYGLQSVVFNQPPPPPPDPPTTYTNPSGVRQTDYLPPVSSIVIGPGATRDFYMLGYKSGDLQPGIYEWKAKVNPDGSAREATTGNNEGSAQIPAS